MYMFLTAEIAFCVILDELKRKSGFSAGSRKRKIISRGACTFITVRCIWFPYTCLYIATMLLSVTCLWSDKGKPIPMDTCTWYLYNKTQVYYGQLTWSQRNKNFWLFSTLYLFHYKMDSPIIRALNTLYIVQHFHSSHVLVSKNAVCRKC